MGAGSARVDTEGKQSGNTEGKQIGLELEIRRENTEGKQ
jgi:hypothetical protein